MRKDQTEVEPAKPDFSKVQVVPWGTPTIEDLAWMVRLLGETHAKPPDKSERLWFDVV